MDYFLEQKNICNKYGAGFAPVFPELKIGISKSALDGDYPVHGLRHKSTRETSGWFIWAGEYREDDDFFKPIHSKHLAEIRPEVIKFLGLEAGWRFLMAPDYEDVWFDSGLLNVDL